MVVAGGESSVSVRVMLDDNAVFKDVLHVLVAEGSDINVPLEATGACWCLQHDAYARGMLPSYLALQVACLLRLLMHVCCLQHSIVIISADSSCSARFGLQVWAAQSCQRFCPAHN